jgi:O-antigen/teichoic acid export membrane protein
MSAQAAAIAGAERAVARTDKPRAAGSGAWLLSAAMVGTGVLTYAFHVLAARSLGPHAYGQIAVLWAAVFLGAVVLFRPLEQTTSRAIADRLTRGEEVGSVVRSVALLAAAVLAVVGIGIAVGWAALTDRLFLGDGLMTAMLVAGIAAYGVAYLVRGLLGGSRWFAGYSLALGGDSLVRLAVAAPLVVLASQTVAAIAVVAAGLGGAIVPLLVGRARLAPIFHGRAGSRFHAGAAVAFAAPAGVIAASDQLLVNGGPLLVMLGGASRASSTAGVVFAATMLVRGPVYVFQGVAAALLPNLTHLQADDDVRPFRRAVLQTAAFLLVAGGLIVAFATLVGPQAMRILYGSGFDAGRAQLGFLGAGVGCYLAASTFSQALLALDCGRRAALAWTTAAVVFVGVYASLPGAQLTRIALAFFAAALVDLVLLGAALLRRIERR